jgi:prevent-host-death family protein
MTRVSTTAARKNFSGTLERVARKGERILLQRGGKDIAAIVSVEDLELLEELEDRRDVEDARVALREPGPSIPYEQVRRELGLDK